MKHASKVGILLVILYIICLAYKFIISDPSVAQLHLLLLELSLPGFTGFTIGSIIWGGVLAFIYGFAGSRVFHVLHRNCCEPK